MESLVTLKGCYINSVFNLNVLDVSSINEQRKMANKHKKTTFKIITKMQIKMITFLL